LDAREAAKFPGGSARGFAQSINLIDIDSSARYRLWNARADFLQLVAWKYLKKVVVGKRFEFTADERVSDLDKNAVAKESRPGAEG
jgi:hypothetical protein